METEFGSSVLKASSVNCYPWSTFYHHSITTWLTSQSTLDWHLHWYSVITGLTSVGRHSPESWLIFIIDMPSRVDRYIWVSWHPANYWPTVDWVSIECLSRCRLSVNLVSTEYRVLIEMSMECWSKVSIDTQPGMP